MNLFTTSNKKTIVLGKQLGRGGEASVYGIQDSPDLVAKIYHKPNQKKYEKLGVMLSYPPADKSALAWPEELIFDSKNSFSGYSMPRVSGVHPIFRIYNPSERLNTCPEFNYNYLLRTARNLHAAASSIHKVGHVIGDVNESNILVSSQAILKFVDTDSFQITDQNERKTYLCPVGKTEFTPPELQGADFSKALRDEFADRFSLAVLSYQLLMEGWHPYSLVWPHSSNPPSIPEKIKRGLFAYSRNTHYQPPPNAPDFNNLPENLKGLFLSCFGDGTTNKYLRPAPDIWITALTEAEEALLQCTDNSAHFYFNHLSKCPWCKHDNKFHQISLPPLQWSIPLEDTSRQVHQTIQGPKKAHAAEGTVSGNWESVGGTKETDTIEIFNETAWCMLRIDVIYEDACRQASQFKWWTSIYITVGFVIIIATLIITALSLTPFNDSIIGAILSIGGGLLVLILSTYPFLKIGEQESKKKSIDFIRDSLCHPNMSLSRKESFIDEIYKKAMSGLE